MKDGIIKLDSDKAKIFNFTSDKFLGYLWKNGDYIWISFIESLNEGKGNLKQLFDNIESKGFKIIVPTPSNRMEKICNIRGMKKVMIDGFECMKNESKSQTSN